MKLSFTGRNIKITDALENTIGEKLSKLDKYFPTDFPAKVTLSAQKNVGKLEVTLIAGHDYIRAEAYNADLGVAADLVVDKLSKQISKHKEKLMRKGKDTIRFENVAPYVLTKDEIPQDDKVIVKRKQFGYKPMTEEEAILQMELLDHDFFVFDNAKTESICVVYRRADGYYGLIEPK